MSKDEESGFEPSRRASASEHAGQGAGAGGAPGKRAATQGLPAADPTTAWLGRLQSVQAALDGVGARYLPAMRAALAAREITEARRAGGELAATLARIDSELAAARRWATVTGSAGALALVAPLEAARDARRDEAAPVLALAPPERAALPEVAAFAPHLFLAEAEDRDATEAHARETWVAKVDASEAPAASDNVIDASDRFAAVQRRATADDARDPALVQQHAAAGVAGTGGAIPHLEQIQESFGAHDVSGIQSHVGGAAATAAGAIGAEAYATGNRVAFAAPPSLFVATHEAAHVVQQRAGVSLLGGVGAAGDTYEQHADAVAERVVRGESAEELLGERAGGHAAPVVQRREAAAPQLYLDPPMVLFDGEAGPGRGPARHDHELGPAARPGAGRGAVLHHVSGLTAASSSSGHSYRRSTTGGPPRRYATIAGTSASATPASHSPSG